MIDNKGKLFGRVSLVDIALIVAAIGLVLGFFHRQTSPHIAQIISPDETFYVTLEGAHLRGFTVDAINVGDVLFREHHLQPLGTVVQVIRSPAMDYLLRLDGTAELVEMEGRYTPQIVLRSSGSITDIGYFVNGVDHVAPGSEVIIVSNRVFIPNGRVADVSRSMP